jgi:dephospho-CoA kinase
MLCIRTESEPIGKANMGVNDLTPTHILYKNIGFKTDDILIDDEYIESRSKLDYSWHTSYINSRIIIQNDIILRFLQRLEPIKEEKPWIIFTAGVMGSGKTYVMNWLRQHDKFPYNIKNASYIDPDFIKNALPETHIHGSNQIISSCITHKESCTIAEIIENEILKLHRTIIIDGTLKDTKWFEKYIDKIHEEYPSYRFAIIHIDANSEITHQRAKKREIDTGRMVPTKLIDVALFSVPESVKKLSSKVDAVVSFNNNIDNTDPKCSISFEDFYKIWYDS